ncbi:protein real-time isoform X2 [Folsomia candida]|uniref:CRAL-TRIO domain-containing protein n=1 Tax=Folsomia candida TaxID=158441 RepID=A0A226EBM7_FOLCA|nr:protein real-time isoform X2 [Folsomia candida]OXA54819.1 hypothetical protein Fcan01_10442 [Folsomia candida]
MDFYKLSSALITCMLFVVIDVHVEGIEIEKELRLSSLEKQKLEKFKITVKQIPSQDWQKSDLALIRWLRGHNLNIQQAETAFKANLKWREENKIDSILDDDWTNFQDNFYFDDTGTDYAGRPVIAADVSEWDVRNAVVSGDADNLVRYMFRAVESGATRVRKSQENGQNVTQWQVVLNMDSFNLVQHGCLQCLPVYLRFITAHEAYYPFGADKIIIINTPAAFEIVLNLVRPVMSSAMRDSLHVFGTNKAVWKKFLLSLIPGDQLGSHFGGTKL